MADIPLRIAKAMQGLQNWCYSVRCNECDMCSQCRLGDMLYSRTDYRFVTDKDIMRLEKREPRTMQINLFGGYTK
jgi:hypothetical protein